MKRLICGALVAASLVCGVGCTPKIEYVDRVEYVDREVIVEVPTEVIVEVPVETIKEVVKTKTIYTPFDISQINILTPSQVDELEVGDTITNVLVWRGSLAKGIKEIKQPECVYNDKNYSYTYSIELSVLLEGYYSNIYFYDTSYSSSSNSTFCISGTITDIQKTKNNLGYTETITVFIDTTKGE